jgi:hypothetical protein
MLINQPVPFDGSEEQCRKNFNTHSWASYDEIDYNCAVCDCKPWHAAASYPCGIEPPRITIKVE